MKWVIVSLVNAFPVMPRLANHGVVYQWAAPRDAVLRCCTSTGLLALLQCAPPQDLASLLLRFWANRVGRLSLEGWALPDDQSLACWNCNHYPASRRGVWIRQHSAWFVSVSA